MHVMSNGQVTIMDGIEASTQQAESQRRVANGEWWVLRIVKIHDSGLRTQP